jgi:hypothetical protein
MVVKAVRHKKISHKRTKKFVRFESEDYVHKLAPSWRRPRGCSFLLCKVSITESEDDSEETDLCPRAVTELTRRPG